MSDFAYLNNFEYIEINTLTGFNMNIITLDLVENLARSVVENIPTPNILERFGSMIDSMPKWARICSLPILIPLEIFIGISYLSPIHFTYIMFADFVFYPQEESSISY